MAVSPGSGAGFVQAAAFERCVAVRPVRPWNERGREGGRERESEGEGRAGEKERGRKGGGEGWRDEMSRQDSVDALQESERGGRTAADWSGIFFCFVALGLELSDTKVYES